jgi:HNH endonuclease
LYFVGDLTNFYNQVRWSDTGCWIWQGSKTHDGYGRYFVDGREVRAHVYAWEYDYAQVRPGQFVCHTCDTPPCVNPRHLFCASQGGNMAGMVAKGRQARGARHPQARIRPDVAHRAIKWHLSGTPVHELAQMLSIAPQ